jgi:hypothetical protein
MFASLFFLPLSKYPHVMFVISSVMYMVVSCLIYQFDYLEVETLSIFITKIVINILVSGLVVLFILWLIKKTFTLQIKAESQRDTIKTILDSLPDGVVLLDQN